MQAVCYLYYDYLVQAATRIYHGFSIENLGSLDVLLSRLPELKRPENACEMLYFAVRAVWQRGSELKCIFSNRTKARFKQKGLLRGVPFEMSLLFVRQLTPAKVRVLSVVFSAMRLLMEAPLLCQLQSQGVRGIEECVRLNFRPRCCHWSVPGHGNTSLVGAFYRHRDPGMPQAVLERLTRGGGPLSEAWRLLAEADGRRNLGQEYSSVIWAGLEELRRASVGKFEVAGPALALLLPPVAGPPVHLVWHLLEKLSLENSVTLPVIVPEGCRANFASCNPSLAAVMPTIELSLLPGHDAVSDSVRELFDFHCGRDVKHTITTAASEASGHNFFFVEVGGFLGDCLLWAGAFLGPARFRALEVEPNVAATGRLLESASRAGFASSVMIHREALGDGQSYRVMPNSGGDPVWTLCDLDTHPRSPGKKGCVYRQLRTLDDVVSSWDALPAGALLDLVRIKTQGSERLVIRGFQRHLAAGRARRLHVELGIEESDELIQAMKPRYRLELELTVRQGRVKRLVFVLAQ